MKSGKIHIYTGDGHGKTPAALGEALYAASAGKQVVVIQFMKGKGIFENDFVKRRFFGAANVRLVLWRS